MLKTTSMFADAEGFMNADRFSMTPMSTPTASTAGRIDAITYTAVRNTPGHLLDIRDRWTRPSSNDLGYKVCQTGASEQQESTMSCGRSVLSTRDGAQRKAGW